MAELPSETTVRTLPGWGDPVERERARAAWLATVPADREAWIFGYGSLLWNPGFPFEEVVPATLFGYHRGFCIYSHYYRGTPARPGLVLGLDRGGSCRGRAFRVPAAAAREVLGRLWDREMVYRVYLPRLLAARGGGRRIACYTFVANPGHEQYAGQLAPAAAAAMILAAQGRSGTNRDYLDNTVRHLDELGLRDGALHRLQRLVSDHAKIGRSVAP